VRVSRKHLHKARSQNSKSEALPGSSGEGLFHDPYGIGTRIMKSSMCGAGCVGLVRCGVRPFEEQAVPELRFGDLAGPHVLDR